MTHDLPAVPANARRPKKKLYSKLVAASLWLHIYLSMFGFGVIFFFALTGLTLNHPTWFGASQELVEQFDGKMTPQWLATREGHDQEESEVTDKLSVVEFLRSTHHISGAVAEFRTDESECTVTFKGPAFAADAYINRDDGAYQLSITRFGLVAMLNDLHKGRDSGQAWSLLIDISAILMLVSSLSGLLILFFLKRKRVAGTMTALVGCLLAIAVFYWLVP